MDAEAAIAVPVVAIQHERRILLVLTIASFLAVINFSATAPFFPQIARDLDTTVPLLGQVPTTMTLLAALLGLAVGPLAERYGYRRLMIVGIIGVGVNLLGTGLAPTYVTLLGLAVSGGLGDAILFGLPLAIAGTRFQGDARRRAIAWTSAALPAGSVLGIPLLTLAGEVISWRVVFIIAGVATLVSASLAAAWLPRDGAVRAIQATEVAVPLVRRIYRQLSTTYRPLLRHRPLLLMYAVGGLRMAGWSSMAVYLGAFLSDDLGFKPGLVGAAYSLSGVAALIGSIAAARLQHVPILQRLSWTIALPAVLLGLAFELPVGAIAVLGLLAAAAFIAAFSYVGLMTLTVAQAQASGGGTAAAMVLTGAILNLGVTIGGAVGGILLATSGWPAVGVGLTLLALASAALLTRVTD